jgi:glyoxylase-like metal-dependent hydrolase (beta-lactamase superfamily II)
MLEKLWVVGPFQCNCRLIACPRTGDAALIDAGDDAATILEGLAGAKTESGRLIQVKYLLHTHGHLDHVGATRGVREGLASAGVSSIAPKIALHKGDEPLYLQLRTQGQMFGIQYDEPLPIDHFLEDGEHLAIGDLKLSVIHNPGHSPGSVSFRLHEDSAPKTRETLYSGDTLFHESVGRTDLWGADGDAMFRNIRQRLLTLDGDTRVCPGHGPDTSIAHEKRANPFLK